MLSGLVASTITRNLVSTMDLEAVWGGLNAWGQGRRWDQPLPDRGYAHVATPGPQATTSVNATRANVGRIGAASSSSFCRGGRILRSPVDRLF
jgi:hypothetical protein